MNFDRTKLTNITIHWSINLNHYLVKQVHSGLLNQTFILRSNNELLVLQKLHPAVSAPGCTLNYKALTDYLTSQNKISQTLRPTTNGELWITNKAGDKWRLLVGVEGQVFETTPNQYVAEQAGKLLAQFHVAVRKFAQPLQPTLPMFRYNEVLSKLHRYQDKFLNDASPLVREAYKLLSDQLPLLILPSDLPVQIIHTDPKISNFLFDEKQVGICMIDFDTVQPLSPLYDLGDLIRSVCGGQEDDPQNKFNQNFYQAILKGYVSDASHILSETEKALIPRACQLVMLGLAARFLNDYVDDSYFGWDENRYETRRAHNLARCLGQIALFKSYAQTQ